MTAEILNKWTNNYDLFKLFVTKKVTFVKGEQVVSIVLPTLENLLLDDNLSYLFFFMKMEKKDLDNLFCLWKVENHYEALLVLLFGGARYQEYKKLYDYIWKALEKIIPDISIKDRKLKINNVYLDNELWDEIWQIVLLSKNDKRNITKPTQYSSEASRRYHEQLEEREAKIRKIREQSKQNAELDKDFLLKMFLTITYAFPQFSFEFLWQQTLAQILWLKSTAAKAINYNIEASAYAAGNLKKIQFFLDK